MKRTLRTLVALIVAAGIWLPAFHLFFKPDLTDYRHPTALPVKTEMLLKRHLALWRDPALRERELGKMNARNPEWNFMSRTFFVLALANLAIRDPAYQTEALEIMDLIIGQTLKLEREYGMHHFLLPYSQGSPWVVRPEQSVFVDGEINLMLAARRMVEEEESYRTAMKARTSKIITQMEKSPVLCAESYPNECWLFCNSVGVASIQMADTLDGTDHSAFTGRWLAAIKQHLVHRETGILIAAFCVDGSPHPAGPVPEGSTIWLAAHMLQIVDEPFANDQYQRSRAELGRSFLGCSYAMEWPKSCKASADVDSGPIIPVFEASAGSSGLAILGAAAFNDEEYLSGLMTSLSFAAFPTVNDGQLQYQASNPVGDAVILYAMLQGPLWNEVNRRKKQ